MQKVGEIVLWSAGGILGGILFAWLVGDWDWGRFLFGTCICFFVGVHNSNLRRAT